MAGKAALLGAVTAGLLLAGYTAPAFADTTGEGRRAMHGDRTITRMDTNKDGKVTLDEFKAGASAAFKAFDADGDGAVTKSEIEARHTAFKDARKTLRKADDADKAAAREALRTSGPFMLPGTGRMFDRTDTDKSGTLSEAEVLAAAEKIFERHDSNKDGAIDQADARKGKDWKGRKGKDRAHHAGRMLKRADTDGDGKVSLVEFTQGAEKMFKRLDANGDGFISADEMGKRGK